MEQRWQKAEKWVYYFLCGFALSSSLSIAAGNIFLALALIASIYRLYLKHDDIKESLCKEKTVALLFGLYALAMLVSIVNSEHAVRSLRFWSDYYIYRMSGLYMVLLMVRDKKRLLKLLALAAASFLINISICPWETFAKGVKRADGLVGFYMTTGSFMSMWSPLLLLGVLESFHRKKYRIPAVAVFAFLILAEFCNQTRGAWMAFAVTAVFVILLYMRNLKKSIALILGLLICIGGVFATVPSLNRRLVSISNMKANNERLLIWTSASNMYRDHPILGLGMAEFEMQYRKHYIMPKAKQPGLTHAHSNIMQVAAECGTVGILAWLAFWGYSIWFGIKGWWRTKYAPYIAWSAVILGLLVQGLTEYNLGNSMVSKELWFLLGVFMQLIWLYRQENSNQN